jgi:hypothetical protein
MALNLPNQPQPDFALMANEVALVAGELRKCANIPAVQQGDAILQALRGLDARFDRIDTRLDQMDARFDQMEARALATYSSSYSLDTRYH